jgi:uncharacterized membrane protein YdfJ with MMPL/SSD domain
MVAAIRESPMTFTISYFALVFLTALVAGIGWALGLLIVARLSERRA